MTLHDALMLALGAAAAALSRMPRDQVPPDAEDAIDRVYRAVADGYRLRPDPYRPPPDPVTARWVDAIREGGGDGDQ